MKVLVLGGAGYIGSVLCEYLQSKGNTVTIMDILLYENDRKYLPPCEFINGDIRNINDLLPAIENADAVVNLAAISNDPASDLKPLLTWDINYKANEIIANLCKATNKRVIYASSCSVYGFAEKGIFDENSKLNPVSLYARTKMLSENFYLQKDINSIVLRFATVYGYSPKPRFDLVVNTMVGTSYFDKKIVVNGGAQWRPVVHVKDVAHAVYLSIHVKNPKHKIYNVGSNGQNYTIAQLGTLIGQQIPGTAVILNEKAADLRSYKVSFNRIEKELKFKTKYGIAETIKEFYNAFEKRTIKKMEEDVYFRVKYLTNRVYPDSVTKKFLNKFLYNGLLNLI